MNNQFGQDAWDAYLTRIEQEEPKIEALGVTDYCSIDEYEKVREFQTAGRLPDVGLVFPNIELRLPTATKNDHPVNIHLLVSPEDPNHVEEARRFLRTLKFSAGRESYVCDPADLIRLGKAHDSSIKDDGAARAAGTNLFKVSLDNLKQSLGESAWHNRTSSSGWQPVVPMAPPVFVMTAARSKPFVLRSSVWLA
ncbi:hypothetical protein CFI00_17940 [Nocardioides sp. S5]|nr:hypothetical protein CFI00_17940 [Nocardioides sp. S5]